MTQASLPTSLWWRFFRGAAILAFCLGVQHLLERWESHRLQYDGSFLDLRSPGGVWWADVRKTDPWIYAPQDMHVVVAPLEYGLFGLPRKPFEAFAFTVYNDGASLGPDNIVARWEGDSVLSIVARGQDQADSSYRVDLSEKRAWWRHDRLGFIPGTLLTWLVFWLLLEFAWATFRSSVQDPSPDANPDPQGSPEPRP